jgi:hypothetical protein
MRSTSSLRAAGSAGPAISSKSAYRPTGGIRRPAGAFLGDRRDVIDSPQTRHRGQTMSEKMLSYHDKIHAWAKEMRPAVASALNNTRNQKEAAEFLNEAGLTTYNGKKWTVYNLRAFRRTYLV